MAGIAGKVAEKFYDTCRKVSRTAYGASLPAAVVAPMGTIGSPVPEYSCDGLIAYNSTPLANMAFKARIKAGFGTHGKKNVAVAHVPGWNHPEYGDFVVGFSKYEQGLHAEDDILAQLAKADVSPKKIAALYSERQPCPVCGPNLEGALKEGTEVTWSVMYGSDKMLNSASKKILQGMIQAQ